MSNIKKLKEKRKQCKASITRIETFVMEKIIETDPVDQNIIDQLIIRQGMLSKNFEDYKNVQLDICVLDEDDTESIDEFEDKYYNILSMINKAITQNKTSLGNSASSEVKVEKGFVSTTKLPNIDIPYFDGKNLNNYKPFSEMFLAVIGTNIDLSNVQKLFYLRNYLKGEALELIINLPLINDSYNEAIKILNNRFDNETMLINSHIYSLLDIPNLQKGTAAGIRDFVSKIKQQVSALKNLKQDVDKWDMMLICIFSKKLDSYTNRSYQLDRNSSNLPTLNEFLHYLENRATALEAVTLPEHTKKERVCNVATKNNKSNENNCKFCNISGHKIYCCSKFKAAAVSERLKFIENNKHCKICLNNHAGKCKFSFKCSVCKSDHNSLLHQYINETNVVSTHHCLSRTSSTNVLLPTVRVKVKAQDGKEYFVRGLLDSGSQTSFICSELAKKLKCRTFTNSLNIIGIAKNVTNIQKSTNLNIHSCIYNYKLNVECAIVDNITTNLPQYQFNPSNINIPKNIMLSDNEYNIPGNISLLLGANVFFQILVTGTIKLGLDNLVLQNTLFGFVASGAIPEMSQELCHTSVVSLHATSSKENLEQLISKFWETEKVPETFREVESDQEACESSFQNSVEKIKNRFQVKLPLKKPLSDLQLGDSFSIAYKRFLNLEKRFQRDPLLFDQYNNFIKEYIALNHAKHYDLNIYHEQKQEAYFLAHHPVIREDNKTTRLRVVFDGSMKTKNQISLNDTMYNGAVVQKELFDILILFRTYKFVLLTDIKKMYRQILIHPSHRILQNVLWRENPNQPIECLQLQTVTYGLKSSPFLATRCLAELAHIEEENFPLASKALLHNTYVDDVISGGDSISEVIQLKNELIDILHKGSFELHKWCSNHPEILKDIPIENQQFDEIDMSQNNTIVKTLGLSYNIQSDMLKVNCPFTIDSCLTKRQVLSFICKFYDPLGLVGPIFVTAKVIMQKLWVRKLNWDDFLPDDLSGAWKTFASSLIHMPVINIPRNLNFVGAHRVELVGFCDSSSFAFGCCIYIRSIYIDRVTVDLLCSKSRIAPINKELTIPKLELNSALLLSKLVSKIYDLLSSKINEVHLYSDSNISLAWMKQNPIKLNAYVANRVLQIQTLTSKFSWSYVNTKENPSDCLSRGMEPNMLLSNNLWWHGPTFLSNITFIHKQPDIQLSDQLPEMKVHVCTQVIEKLSFFNKFSSISKMQRIMAYVLRFYTNLKNKKRNSGNLSASELNNALNVIIKHEQKFYFQEEIKSLNSKTDIKSNLKLLHPFLDGKGLLRVGGRLQNANITYDQRHPVILPKNSHITNLIIIREHKNLLHAGQKQVISSLNLKFWLINGNREVKKNIHKCVTCFRLKAQCSEQLMGSLPTARVNFARPFQNVGIDFCGPFMIKQSRLRKTVMSKSYIALFVCFSIKAIHMELISDMTTENFLAALKRFISRRGKPAQIYCDNGATFKGANNQLKEFYKVQSSEENKNSVENFSASEGITFNFIPSYSPVFGGLWEAGVKSAKHHLKRVVGNNVLTYEQFNTVIIQIEGILNSRPITSMSQDPTDLSYLTPGHFLIGAPITSFPEPDISSVPINRLKFWKLCTQMQQHFWKKWQKDYLVQLQNRPKWQKDIPNVQENMLVLLKDENSSPLNWPMARIVRIIPGKDNKVRVVELKTKTGTYLRSITKIAILPIY